VPPPLERLFQYRDRLDRVLATTKSLSVGDFVLLVGDIASDTIRDDLKSVGVDATPSVLIDVQTTYWKIVQCLGEVEAQVSRSKVLEATLPGQQRVDQMLDVLASAEKNASLDPEEAFARARFTELAYDRQTLLDHFLIAQGRMLGSFTAFPHQIRTARRILEQMNGLAIVADEVGLGKTNIAGLVMEEILAHQPSAAILILVPPNLREQWREELPKFFGRQILSDLLPITPTDFAQAPILLLSFDHAKGDGKENVVAEILLRRTWDLVVLDEAHECRNDGIIRYKFVYSLRALGRLFMSATPIQNSGYDMYNLATLLVPGLFGEKRAFAEHYMQDDQLLKDTDALSRSLDPIMTRTLRRDTGLRFAKRKLTLVEIKEFKPQESVLYDDLLNLLKSVYQRHMGASAEIVRASGRQQHVSQFVLIAMVVLREMASHPNSALNTLKTALHKRVKDLADLSRDTSDLQTLDSFIERYTVQRWDPSHHAKSERLLKEAQKLLRNGRKFIIYVNYIATQKIIAKLLQKRHPDVEVIGYDGSMGPGDKTSALQQFEKASRGCMVSTDSSSQGLNLDFADCIINYDFPWNPMRVEQRIGRVDRVKQKSEQVDVFNFRTRGTVEEYVQIVLTRKLAECRSVLGDFDSPLQIEKIYENKLSIGIGTALLESSDAVDMRKRMQRLGEDDFRRYIGENSIYGNQPPKQWQWKPSN
jgi:SNF2 family DNA or RNA helicase